MGEIKFTLETAHEWFPVKKILKNAIAKHVEETGFTLSWDQAIVLEVE